MLVVLASLACRSKAPAPPRDGEVSSDAALVPASTAPALPTRDVEAPGTARAGGAEMDAAINGSGAASSIWSGDSGGVQIDWTTRAIAVRRAGRKTVDLIAIPKSEPGCEGDLSVQILSVVGSIVSYEEFEGTTCEGAAHPSAITFYAAVDAAHPGRKLRLTDLFADADVLRALMADSVVQRHAPKAAPRTAAELVTALSASQAECEYAFEKDLLNRFAFHHVEGDRVAVRIGLSHGCEVARGKLTQLGILLPVPPKLKDALDRASSRTEGFLMRDGSLVSKGQTTSIQF